MSSSRRSESGAAILRISAHFDDVPAATTMPFAITASRHDTNCFPLMSASLGDACFSARRARTDENAETSAMENCQINYGQRSALIAVDETLAPMPAERNWPCRNTPRARYSANLNSAQIRRWRQPFANGRTSSTSALPRLRARPLKGRGTAEGPIMYDPGEYGR